MSDTDVPDLYQLLDRIRQATGMSVIVGPFGGLKPGQVAIRYAHSLDLDPEVLTPPMGVRAWAETMLRSAERA